jgi:hypothetical protein
MRAGDIKPLHVTQWVDSHESWLGGARNAVICVKRTFNWAHAEGLLDVNPLNHVKKPAKRPRTRIVTSAEKKEILAAIRDKQ